MPVVLRIKGYRFFFYSDEGNEPINMHVEKGEARGKIWLVPSIEEEFLYGFNPNEIRSIRKIIEEHYELLKVKRNEHFGR